MTLGEELLKYLNTISFEITRRCNLNCKWCSKGEPQNLDISKEIIDKTLEEIQAYYWWRTIFKTRINRISY